METLDFSRRSFMGLALAGASASLLGSGCSTAGACGKSACTCGKYEFRFGMAGYTMCKRSLDETLDILKKTDIHYLCVKDFHLPLTATDADMQAFRRKCALADVTPYLAGPLYTHEPDETRRFFEYARRLGVDTVVGVPFEWFVDPATGKKNRRSSRKLLECIDKLVREFDIRYAIHNHGPQMNHLFPNVAAGWELVKDLDPRIGFCMDVGWEYACGSDPVETIRTHHDRIYDLHFKNFEIGKPNGASIPLPRGKINYVDVMRALRDVRYAGVCALEYEKDFKDNLAPIAECVGYFRGVADALNA